MYSVSELLFKLRSAHVAQAHVAQDACKRE